MPEPPITARAAAAIVGRSAKTVARMALRQELPAFRPASPSGRSHWLFLESELLRWRAQQRQAQSPLPPAGTALHRRSTRLQLVGGQG